MVQVVIVVLDATTWGTVLHSCRSFVVRLKDGPVYSWLSAAFCGDDRHTRIQHIRTAYTHTHTRTRIQTNTHTRDTHTHIRHIDTDIHTHTNIHHTHTQTHTPTNTNKQTNMWYTHHTHIQTHIAHTHTHAYIHYRMHKSELCQQTSNWCYILKSYRNRTRVSWFCKLAHYEWAKRRLGSNHETKQQYIHHLNNICTWRQYICTWHMYIWATIEKAETKFWTKTRTTAALVNTSVCREVNNI